ncbi:MAG TPA: thioredoxin domain-containing protein [Candidatus Limnocylindria bacterium]|nr:thioredoxin domain-containing protein [Candidatus Limnocylindria bacterium]
MSSSHSNHLLHEKSPYLQQHAHNPVDWYPWGDEAINLAKAEGKPIFLSIGYSTCHWCHVMERESFEDEAVGAYLKEHFVSIKVDREERPDVDKIYMGYVQATTGSGGWPLNVFLTPDLKPFYGGTYFPPTAKHGRPSLMDLLHRIVELWKTRHADILHSAAETTERLQSMNHSDADNAFPTGLRELHGAGEVFLQEFDHTHGGFGGAPKFPRPSQPIYLLRYARRFGDQRAVDAVLHTCERMAAGGIYDQLGGGFSRYSVDEQWLVPHFEKMLYDQAQLVHLYLDAYQIRRDPHLAQVIRETVNYVLRDMTHPSGGFYSAEDADSEGYEGKFYCWTLAEVKALLDPKELALAIRYFGLTEGGNFVDHSHPAPLKHQNVLHIADGQLKPGEEEVLARVKQKLLEVRATRIRPHRDEKILSSWNGMMLSALARAAAVLGDETYRQAAEHNSYFIRTELWDEATQTLYHRWRDGQRDTVQLLDAYAHQMTAHLDLYEASLNPAHLEFAVALAGGMIKCFYDPAAGAFWQSGTDTPHLLLRNKEDYDGAEPSGNSVAALGLLRLASICDRKDWKEAAEKTLRLFAQRLHQMPQAVPHLCLALDFAQQEPKRVAIVGDWTCGSTQALLDGAHAVYEPHRVVLGNIGPVDTFVKDLPVEEEFSRAFLCTGTACQPPTRSRKDVEAFLNHNEQPH